MTDIDAEVVGVGDVRMVRTFRIGPDGELFPVNFVTAWTDGWNTAVCQAGHPHRPPSAECRCGFYLYSDPAYVLAQPPARQVLAVAAVNGPMEAGTRGARVGRARVEAVWLGRRVSDDLVEAVARRYPGTVVFRDRAAMQRRFPLTRLDGFAAPRVGERARRRLRYVVWAYLALTVAVGCVPSRTLLTSAPGSLLWLAVLSGGVALLLTAIGQRSQVTALQGVDAVAWLVTADAMTPWQWMARSMLFTLVLAAAAVWWHAALPGRPVRPPTRVEGWLRRRGRPLYGPDATPG
jgi:hypothetical protein